LTSADRRRAKSIRFDDDPREILIAAWIGAASRDRMDLIQRALGSI